MSRTYIPAKLRRQVIARAEGLCEYCLFPSEDAYFGCAIDHIISEKHGGATASDNLAYSCLYCNLAKGSDLGSLDPESHELVRFFDPRRDRWAEHFRLAEDLRIDPHTAIGAVTVKILGFNRNERLLERQVLAEEGRYPSAAAKRHLAPS